MVKKREFVVSLGLTSKPQLSLLKIHPLDFKIPFGLRLPAQVVMRLVWCSGDEGPRQRGGP
jgi:hypothetical protein